MFSLLVGAALQVSAAVMLPNGYQDMNWGTTIEELTSRLEVHKATRGTEFNYADHTEVNPDVYVQITADKTRIEYYFFEGRLYKVYVVYDRSKSNAEFYQQLIADTRKQYGSAQSHYQEKVFGLLILHVKWEDKISSLDLRSGAGYIYEVRVDKAAELRKANQLRHKRSLENSI